MKSVLVVVIFMLGWNALASEQIYSCQVNSTSKGFDLPVRPVTGFLSNERSSKLVIYNYGRTTLDLIVDKNGNLDGSVNGQRRFILSGSASDGKYESAELQGTIKCSAPRAVGADFMDISSGAILNNSAGADGRPAPLSYIESLKNKCYISNAKEAAESLKLSAYALHDRKGKAEVRLGKNGSLLVTVDQRDCLESIGHSVDDYQCLKYSEIYQKTYEVPRCSHPDDFIDPRS